MEKVVTMGKFYDVYSLLVITFAPVIVLLVGIKFQLDFTNIMLLIIALLLYSIAGDVWSIRRKNERERT